MACSSAPFRTRVPRGSVARHAHLGCAKSRLVGEHDEPALRRGREPRSVQGRDHRNGASHQGPDATRVRFDRPPRGLDSACDFVLRLSLATESRSRYGSPISHDETHEARRCHLRPPHDRSYPTSCARQHPRPALDAGRALWRHSLGKCRQRSDRDGSHDRNRALRSGRLRCTEIHEAVLTLLRSNGAAHRP